MASKIVLSITDISSQGLGIAKAHGKVYFVHSAYPHQVVEAAIIQEKKRYTICRATTLLEDHLESRPYLCPHSHCGGCHLRYIPYHQQTLYKQQFLQNAFSKIARFDISPQPMRTMDNPYSYRTRVDFHYGYTGLGKKELGFYAQQSHTIIPITHCALVHKDMMDIISIARSNLQKSTAPIYHNKKGFWRHLSLRYAIASQQYMVHCITSPQEQYYPQVQHLFQDIQEAFPSALCVHSIRYSSSSIAQGEHYITKQEALLEQIPTSHGVISLLYGANSFFQNNYTMMNILYRDIATECPPQERYLDLCTGVGSIALSCFTQAKHIIGIDSNKEAIVYAQQNAIDNGIEAKFKVIDMNNLCAEDCSNVDIICVDPPRAGLDAKSLTYIASSNAKKIIYVSCNPATMARDCSILKEHYDIHHSRGYDMFPHTMHCESLTILLRR